MLGTGYFLKIAKINSQRKKKTICPHKQKLVPANHKNFVRHGMFYFFEKTNKKVRMIALIVYQTRVMDKFDKFVLLRQSWDK